MWHWNWTKTDINGKEKGLYYLLEDQADQLEQFLQGRALRVIIYRIFFEIWTDNRGWDGYKLAKRYRVHPRVQGNSHFEGCLHQTASRESLKRKGQRRDPDFILPDYKAEGKDRGFTPWQA